MKRVSIVIPTFNQDRYLPSCIDHCLFQTYGNLEIIIVDGGSTDGTKEYLENLEREIGERSISPICEMDEEGQILRRRMQAYPQSRDIEIVTFKEDIGATRTCNEGLSRISGQYCTYVVGDDRPHPHMIEELVRALESTGADFVYSDLDVMNDEGRIMRQVRCPDYSFESCFASWYHIGVSRLYRALWHERVGIMDEAYECANDYDQYLRFAMAGARFHHVPKILYSVRYHGEDRRTGQHTEERYFRLIEESKQCAFRARDWLKQKSVDSG